KVHDHLVSPTKFHRLRLKVLLNEDDAHVATVTGVWRTANWHERETFDLFGIVFDDHPDLRRILLPDDWQGHALRKDFPLRGYEPYSLEEKVAQIQSVNCVRPSQTKVCATETNEYQRRHSAAIRSCRSSARHADDDFDGAAASFDT